VKLDIEHVNSDYIAMSHRDVTDRCAAAAATDNTPPVVKENAPDDQLIGN